MASLSLDPSVEMMSRMAVHNYDIFLVVSALVFVGIAFLQYVSLLLNVYLADMGTYRVLNLLHVSNTV